MKIEIEISTSKIVKIDVELPYYYAHRLDSDFDESTIYGKITETQHISIHEYSDEKYEIDCESHHSIKYTGLGPYFSEEHKSTEDAYKRALARCRRFLNSL